MNVISEHVIDLKTAVSPETLDEWMISASNFSRGHSTKERYG